MERANKSCRHGNRQRKIYSNWFALNREFYSRASWHIWNCLSDWKTEWIILKPDAKIADSTFLLPLDTRRMNRLEHRKRGQIDKGIREHCQPCELPVLTEHHLPSCSAVTWFAVGMLFQNTAWVFLPSAEVLIHWRAFTASFIHSP